MCWLGGIGKCASELMRRLKLVLFVLASILATGANKSRRLSEVKARKRNWLIISAQRATCSLGSLALACFTASVCVWFSRLLADA